LLLVFFLLNSRGWLNREIFWLKWFLFFNFLFFCGGVVKSWGFLWRNIFFFFFFIFWGGGGGGGWGLSSHLVVACFSMYDLRTFDFLDRTKS